MKCKCGGPMREHVIALDDIWLICVLCGREQPKGEVTLPAPPATIPPSEEEPPMATKQGTCPTCGRKDVSMPSTTKCARCYDRIKKGLDPVTGEPIRKEPPTAVAPPQEEPEPKRSLQEEVLWRMLKLGYKGVAVTRAFRLANVPDTATVEEAIELVAGQIGTDAAAPATPREKGQAEREHRAAGGLDRLLSHPDARTFILQLPDDVHESLAANQITPADVVELLRDLVNHRLVKVAA